MAEPTRAEASCACHMAHQRAAQLCCQTETTSSSDEETDDATLLLPQLKCKVRGEHVEAVPGLRIIHDAISVEEEAAAFAWHARHPGLPANNIHTAHQYGWRFHSCGCPLSASDWLSPLPPWSMRVTERLLQDDPTREFMPSRREWGDDESPSSSSEWGAGPKNALLNRYEAGEGLLPHTDDHRFWTGYVLGYSLGSGVTMTFTPVARLAGGESDVHVYLPQRSAYVLTDAARWQWRHGIRAATSDVVDGVTVPRGPRTSLTLRGINPAWKPPPAEPISTPPPPPPAPPSSLARPASPRGGFSLGGLLAPWK